MRRADNLSTFMERLSRNYGSLKLQVPQRPAQARTGIAKIKVTITEQVRKPTDISKRRSRLLPSVAVIFTDDRIQLALDGEEECWKERLSSNDTAVHTGHFCCGSELLNKSKHRYLT